MIKFKTIPLPELAQMLDKTVAEAKNWCERYEVKIHHEEEKEFVVECQAKSVWLTNLIIYLRAEYGRNWKQEFKKYLE